MEVYIILDNVRSAFNVGSIFRTVGALDFKLQLVGITPTPTRDEKIFKTSLGTTEQVSWEYFVDFKDWERENILPKSSLRMEATKDTGKTATILQQSLILSVEEGVVKEGIDSMEEMEGISENKIASLFDLNSLLQPGSIASLNTGKNRDTSTKIDIKQKNNTDKNSNKGESWEKSGNSKNTEISKEIKNLYLVFGHEINGVSKDFLQISNHILEIPTPGSKKSLNVASCVAIVGYFILEQL